MFFKSLAQKIELSELRLRISELEQANEKLAYANKVYQERLESDYNKASYVIDWSAINAFSVERMWENGHQKTVIGYMLAEPVSTTEGGVTTKDVVREWTLYCSHNEHERLVKEFSEYIKGKRV